MQEGTVGVVPRVERVEQPREFERCSQASSPLEVPT